MRLQKEIRSSYEGTSRGSRRFKHTTCGGLGKVEPPFRKGLKPRGMGASSPHLIRGEAEREAGAAGPSRRAEGQPARPGREGRSGQGAAAQDTGRPATVRTPAPASRSGAGNQRSERAGMRAFRGTKGHGGPNVQSTVGRPGLRSGGHRVGRKTSVLLHRQQEHQNRKDLPVQQNTMSFGPTQSAPRIAAQAGRRKRVCRESNVGLSRQEEIRQEVLDSRQEARRREVVKGSVTRRAPRPVLGE